MLSKDTSRPAPIPARVAPAIAAAALLALGAAASPPRAAAGGGTTEVVCNDQIVHLVRDTEAEFTLDCREAVPDPDFGLRFEITSNPSFGSVVAFDETTGQVRYRPAAGFVGTDALRFRAIYERTGQPTAERQATLVVRAAPNRAPVCEPRAVTAVHDRPVDVDVSCADPDGDPLSVALGPLSPLHGTVESLQPIGPGTARVRYRPNPGFVGLDVFDVVASDGQETSAAARIQVDVVNTVPTCRPGAVRVAPGSAVRIRLSCSDADGDALRLLIADPPSRGRLSGISPAGIVTYRPALGFRGRDRFAYTASDGLAQAAPATVAISVGPRAAAVGTPRLPALGLRVLTVRPRLTRVAVRCPRAALRACRVRVEVLRRGPRARLVRLGVRSVLVRRGRVRAVAVQHRIALVAGTRVTVRAAAPGTAPRTATGRVRLPARTGR